MAKNETLSKYTKTDKNEAKHSQIAKWPIVINQIILKLFKTVKMAILSVKSCVING